MEPGFVLWPYHILLLRVFLKPGIALAVREDASRELTLGCSAIIEQERQRFPVELIFAGKFDKRVFFIGWLFSLLENESRVLTERKKLSVVTLTEVYPADAAQVCREAGDTKANQKRQGKNDISHDCPPSIYLRLAANYP
jgi:hypothetical protein